MRLKFLANAFQVLLLKFNMLENTIKTMRSRNIHGINKLCYYQKVIMYFSKL
jgi:hypothetical protein